MAWGFLNTLGGALSDTVKKTRGIVPTGNGTPPALPTGARTPPFNPAIAAPAIGKPAAPAVALPRLPEAGMNPPLMAPPMNPPPNPGRGILPGGSLDKRGVPIPALPGHGTEPTPYDPVSSRRYDYVMEGAKRNAEGDLSGGFKRSGKDVLKSLLVGAGTGMAATGSPWGALGGMAAGAGGTALAPQQGREMLFDALEMPQIQAQQARQMEQQKLEDEAFRRENERARMEQDALMGRERIAGIQAQAEADRARAEDLRREKFRDAPWGTYSERTGNVNYQRPPGVGTQAAPYTGMPGVGVLNRQTGEITPFPEGVRPKINQQDAMNEVLAEDGSIESIAQSSLDGRRASLLQQLTPAERSYLEAGGPNEEQLKAKLSPEQRAVIDGGSTGDYAKDAATYAAWERIQQTAQADAARARDKWERIQRAEYDKILRETKGEAGRKAAIRRGGGNPAMPRTGGGGGMGSTSPRNVNDLLKYLQ